jgi:hypothetical protein
MRKVSFIKSYQPLYLDKVGIYPSIKEMKRGLSLRAIGTSHLTGTWLVPVSELKKGERIFTTVNSGLFAFFSNPFKNPSCDNF